MQRTCRIHIVCLLEIKLLAIVLFSVDAYFPNDTLAKDTVVSHVAIESHNTVWGEVANCATFNPDRELIEGQQPKDHVAIYIESAQSYLKLLLFTANVSPERDNRDQMVFPNFNSAFGSANVYLNLWRSDKWEERTRTRLRSDCARQP